MVSKKYQKILNFMIYEIDKYTDYLCKHKITPNQFYILWLIYTKDSTNIKKYLASMGNFPREDFDVLVEKGLLIHFNKQAKEYDIINLYVSPEFAESVLIEPDDAWSELFDTYPSHLIVNGNKVPAKTLNYTDSKGVEEAYTKIIKKNKFLHARVIASVNVWKEANNGNATIKIDKFVMGKYWEEIERTTDSGTAKPSYY